MTIFRLISRLWRDNKQSSLFAEQKISGIWQHTTEKHRNSVTSYQNKIFVILIKYEWVDLAKSEEENTLDLGNISTNLDNVKYEEIFDNLLNLNTSIEHILSFSWRLCDTENISERLHEIADTLHLHCELSFMFRATSDNRNFVNISSIYYHVDYHLNTYWLTCGHAECIESW